jgi:gliding motility-associated-like protein
MKNLYLCLLLCLPFSALAQLDSIHWLPPLHARSEWGPQYIYITTPEAIPFDVTITDGTGTPLTTLTVSNSSPQQYYIGNTNQTQLLVTELELHQPLQQRGMILSGPKKFYVNFRTHSTSQNQAGDLTCKGRSALGKTFRIGHLFNESTSNSSRRSNFISIMASENNTQIRLSDYDPGVDFRIQGADQSVTAPLTMTLQKGECVVFSQYMGFNSAAQPPVGLIGALLEASQPIAVNTGSWLGAPVIDNANDMGIDQIVPIELVGDEYILIRGNGSTALETPLVIAHEDNTLVWINGSSSPAATLNAGDYLKVNTSQYDPVTNNMYILSSHPVYVYQIVGGVPSGDDQYRTAGLNFVPPVSCGIPNAVDNIYQPNRIGSLSFDGGLMIVAMRDSAVTLRINGVVTSLGAPDAVPGNPDFVTYRRLTLFSQSNPPNTVSIVAQGAIQVATFGRNNAAGFAAFYSGFSQLSKPTLDLALISDGVCPDTLIARGKFDGIQWILGDSTLQYGPDTSLIVFTPGQYTASAYLGVCRRTNYARDTQQVAFVSPEFPYTLKEPSCYGFKDAGITFGAPFGGFPPYEFSVDEGATFKKDSSFQGLPAGNFHLLVRDSTGCYNRPLEVSIGQPEILSVDLAIKDADDPLKPGGRALLEATPSRPVVQSLWKPADGSGCFLCLEYTAWPEYSQWYTVTVYDDEGCPASDTIWVPVQPNIYAPNVFNPENYTGNGLFYLSSRAPEHVNWLRIYDRWGSLLFENKDFMTNDPQSGWDGMYKGEILPPGVFVYVAELEYSAGRRIYLKGDVTIVR